MPDFMHLLGFYIHSPIFVDEVVPLLQKRGVYRTSYEGTTFRSNLVGS